MLNRVNQDQNLSTQINVNTVQQNELLWKFREYYFQEVRKVIYFPTSFFPVTSQSDTENTMVKEISKKGSQPLLTFQVSKHALRLMLFHRTCMSVGSKSLPIFLSCIDSWKFRDVEHRKGLQTFDQIFRQKLQCISVTHDMLRTLHVYSNSSFFIENLSGFIDIKVGIRICEKPSS